MPDLDVELEPRHFSILEILGIRYTRLLHIISLQYFLFDSFALAAATAGSIFLYATALDLCVYTHLTLS